MFLFFSFMICLFFFLIPGFISKFTKNLNHFNIFISFLQSSTDQIQLFCSWFTKICKSKISPNKWCHNRKQHYMYDVIFLGYRYDLRFWCISMNPLLTLLYIFANISQQLLHWQIFFCEIDHWPLTLEKVWPTNSVDWTMAFSSRSYTYR